MGEQNQDALLAAISDLKNELKSGLSIVQGQLNVIDKRLNLIEQRLGNIEKWVPVDHKELQFQA